MNSFTALIATLALVAPGPSGSKPFGLDIAHDSLSRISIQDVAGQRGEPEPFRDFQDSYLPPVQFQVRIEQRVIIRIAPSPPETREEMLAQLPRVDMPTLYKEKKLDGCIPIAMIAGAQPVQENRLLLFMRDHRVLSAALERACDAEAFYLGFYIERSPDGMLCSGRDKLQSRTGASCEVAQLNRLVAVKD
jgi:hypothetical protein